MTVIAMTREIGSRGTEVAEGVAAALDLTIIDSEIAVTHVAERLGMEESAVQRFMDGTASLVERWQMNKRKLSRYTTEEILRLSLQGNVLIRGWGAAALFRDLPQVISVRVCAPTAFRHRVLMDRIGVNDAEAVREEIERYDAAYARTMRDSFGGDRDDALLYHIVLNTARIAVDDGVKIVCELAKSPHLQDDGSLRAALAELLATRVSAALVEHVPLSMVPAGITVSARSGRITLTSTSSSGRLGALAEEIARDVDGVTEIDNRIISVPSRHVGI